MIASAASMPTSLRSSSSLRKRLPITGGLRWRTSGDIGAGAGLSLGHRPGLGPDPNQPTVSRFRSTIARPRHSRGLAPVSGRTGSSFEPKEGTRNASAITAKEREIPVVWHLPLVSHHLQTETDPALTPWQTASLVIQPAPITTDRLSLVIGTGFRSRAVIFCFFGPSENVVEPGMSESFLPPASAMAISAAFLPSSRASFHTDTVWVPSATRLSAALSPSCPETGTEPARPCAERAATAPPAVPSLEATTASTLLLFLVRICSMFFWALAGSHWSV